MIKKYCEYNLAGNFVGAFEKKQILLALFLLSVGLTITAFSVIILKTGIENEAGSEFIFATKELKNKIGDRLHSHAQLLRSGAAYIESKGGKVSRSEWKDYYEKQFIEKNFPGIQAFEYSVIIPPNQLVGHERKFRREGFPVYSVKPEGKRETYTSITYVEPFKEKNLRAFGYDMFTEPIRRKAMELARDNNIESLSRKITLVQETGHDVQAGTLMYLPVYKRSMPISSVEERRKAIQG